MRWILLAAFLAGCSATLVQNPGGSGLTSAPVNESRSGVVAYRNQGVGINSRRQDAYHKMATACRGPYRIEAEGPQTSTTGYVYNFGNGFAMYSQPQWWYIQFACVQSLADQ